MFYGMLLVSMTLFPRGYRGSCGTPMWNEFYFF